MNKTKIPWTDYTWNPVTGCTKCSEGCANCYAQAMAHRFNWPKGVQLHPERLDEPLHLRKPSNIFPCSMSDLFHEDVPLTIIARMFDVMASATLDCNKRHEHEPECWSGKPHTFQILTKRPARMLQVLTYDLPNYVSECYPGDSALSVALQVQWPLPNVWLGVTAENQRRAEQRIPLLLQIPAAVRFVSVEPMLEAVDLRNLRAHNGALIDCLEGDVKTPDGRDVYAACPSAIDWVICGSESGPGRRPMLLQWARDLRDQCQAAGRAFFLKQLPPMYQAGEPPVLDGKTWTQFPEVRP